MRARRPERELIPRQEVPQRVRVPPGHGHLLQRSEQPVRPRLDLPDEAHMKVPRNEPHVADPLHVTKAPLRLEAGKTMSLVLDVREAEEFASGHLPDARNVPVGKLGDRIAEIEKYKDKPLIVCCASGMRSSKAGRVASS